MPPNRRFYQTILIDSPWPEKGGGRIKRGADKHYTVQKVEHIPGIIRQSPLWLPDPNGCSIWFCATATHLEKAFWVMRQLGMLPVSGLVWKKIGRAGLGQRFRLRHEHVLYARIGRVEVPPPSRREDSVFDAERVYYPGTKKPIHSAKPPRMYEIIETHDPPGSRRAEIFARSLRPGWDSWGNEVHTGGPDGRRIIELADGTRLHRQLEG